jgi:hypothetical protein
MDGRGDTVTLNIYMYLYYKASWGCVECIVEGLSICAYICVSVCLCLCLMCNYVCLCRVCVCAYVCVARAR